MCSVFVRLSTARAQLFIVGGQQGGLYDRVIRISRIQNAGRISDVVSGLAASVSNSFEGVKSK